MKNVRLHGAGAASGHEERGGLQDIADVALQAGLGLHVLAVQLVQGVSQVLPELLFEELRAGEVLRQALAQFFLVAAVIPQGVGVIFIVRIGKGVRQIMGQLSQGIIVPDAV